jgi:hypothetical protein
MKLLSGCLSDINITKNDKCWQGGGRGEGTLHTVGGKVN